MTLNDTLPLPSKIDWSRPFEWSSGEPSQRSGFDCVTACRAWESHTGEESVAVDEETGRILGCEQEDYPFIRNSPLEGDLGVNSMGEVWIKTDNRTIDVGGVVNVSDNPNLAEIERRHLQQLVDGGLPDQHIRLVQKIWSAQNANTSRIRLAYFGGRPVLETEFAAFVDQADIWTAIEAAAASIGAVIDVMDTRPHLDHFSPAPGADPKAGSRPDAQKPGFFFGPDHDRIEKQVAMQIILTDDFTPEQLQKAHELLRSATEQVWPLAGVDIL